MFFKENEVLLYVPIFNKATRLYDGLTLRFEEIPMRDFTHMVTRKKKVPYCTVP